MLMGAAQAQNRMPHMQVHMNFARAALNPVSRSLARPLTLVYLLRASNRHWQKAPSLPVPDTWTPPTTPTRPGATALSKQEGRPQATQAKADEDVKTRAPRP